MEMGRDCGNMARLSDSSELCVSPLKGEVRSSPEPSGCPSAVGGMPIEQSGKFELRACSRTALEKDGGLMHSPIVHNTSV